MKITALNYIRHVYQRIYWWLSDTCRKSNFLSENPFFKIKDVVNTLVIGISFIKKGETARFKKGMPDVYIDTPYQKLLLNKFNDEFGGVDWIHTYGLVEIKDAHVSFPFPIHRLRTITTQQGLGDENDCLCQPRYLLSWFQTFLPVKKTLSTGIMLAMPNYDNYYHWMIEILPRIQMILEDIKYKDIPIILPKTRRPKFINESLSLAGLSDRILHLDNGGYRVEKLIIPTLYAPRSQISGPTVKWLKSHILNQSNPVSTIDRKLVSFDRIFISRDDAGVRKISNTHEVDDLLLRFGFKKVNMSYYTIQEQAIIFSNARLIVGIHGAGLANSIYCKSGSILLELFLDGWFTKAFYNISKFVGMKYGCLLCKNSNGNLVVDTSELKVLIESSEKFLSSPA